MTGHASGRLTVDRALRSNAEQFGTKVAIEFEDVELTYGELDAWINRVATGVRAAGIERGQHVLVMLPNTPVHVAVLYGLHRAGLVYVACSTLFTDHEIAYQLGHSDAVAVVTTPTCQPRFEKLAAELGRAVTTFTAPDLDDALDATTDVGAMLARPGAAWGEEPPAPDELATIIYTSGTTAYPKGVMWTHGQVYLTGRRSRDGLAYHHEDRSLHFFPLYQANGNAATINPMLLVGATIVMVPKFSASRFSETLRDRRISITALSATHAKMLLAQPEREADLDHGPVRSHFGLFLDPPRRAEFERRFGIRLAETYGMTETAGNVAIAPVWTNHTHESAGPPLPGIAIRIVDEEGNDQPTGTPGEILIATLEPGGVTAGYYNDPEATAALLADGWLHSGDVGVLDEDGYLHFMERSKDMIKRSGYNVAPAELERTLLEHPSVAETAVVGVPDPLRDEAIVGFVVLAAGSHAGEGDLLGFCAERLAPYKHLQHILFLDELPLNFLGKVEKKRLREQAIADLAAAGVVTSS